jgi:NifU-like protein involved in Fe-S cluster formation
LRRDAHLLVVALDRLRLLLIYPWRQPKERKALNQVGSTNWNNPLAEDVLALTLGAKRDSLSAIAISSAGSISAIFAASITCSTIALSTRTVSLS